LRNRTRERTIRAGSVRDRVGNWRWGTTTAASTASSATPTSAVTHNIGIRRNIGIVLSGRRVGYFFVGSNVGRAREFLVAIIPMRLVNINANLVVHEKTVGKVTRVSLTFVGSRFLF
jgi:hypothetical protein